MSRAGTVWVTLTGTKVAETGKAVLFDIKKISGEEVELETPRQWFPFSQVSKMTTDKNSVCNDTMMVSEWICKEKGLLEPQSRTKKVKQDEHGFDKLDDSSPWESDDGVGQFD